MRNKIIFGLIGAIVIGVLVFIWVGNGNSTKTTTQPENEVESEEENENEGIEQEEEAADEKTNEEASKVESDEKTKTPFQKYKHYGAECLEIEETIKRGDCFQAVGEEHIEWYLSEDKIDFYFPAQRKQDHWNDVFYKEIEEDDQLSDLIKTDYFDSYVNSPLFTDDYKRGEKVIDLQWRVFSNLIPKERREILEYIYWTDTGADIVFAGVGQNEDGSMYLMFPHFGSLQYHIPDRHTLLHEYGHILTLNINQADVDDRIHDENLSDEEYEQIENSCETVFLNGRCAKEDSYINAFYKQFWSDIKEEHQEINWAYEDEYKDFFFKHEEYFFNSYQGTTVQEDIADTFSTFVLTHSSVTENPEVKYEKIKFLYEYDELVELRTDILENLYNLSVEDGRYY